MSTHRSNLPVHDRMHAIVVQQFGGIDAIHLEDIERPVAGPGQVLVRVHAAGVGPWDALVRAGQSMLKQPLPLIPGSDLSGIVENVGKGVTGFAPGDAVYGATNAQFTGAYAEFALADAHLIARKPPTMSHTEAASVPVVACTAWQLVHTHGQVDRSKRVLVHGAAGNVGAYAVQFAKLAGATVIGTARHGDVAFLKSLGVDQIIDVDVERFEDVVKDVDVVLDTVGGETLDRSFEVVRHGGVIISSVSEPDAERSADKAIRSAFFYVAVDTMTLTRLGDLFASGAITARVGDVLPLSQARAAHEMLDGKPHKTGKIVLKIVS